MDFVADQTLHDASWLPKGKLKLLKNERLPKRVPDTECPRYESDWKALQSELQNSEGLGLDELSSTAEEEPAPPEGIDCGCCYAESLFEDLVQVVSQLRRLDPLLCPRRSLLLLENVGEVPPVLTQ